MAGVDKLKLYIAAPWIHKDAAKQVALQFEAAGFEVTSRWLDFVGGGYDASKETLASEAVKDIEDVLRANGLVVLQYAKSEGKAFEQGLFLAATQFTGVANKIVLVSPDGTKGNVFQNLDDVYVIVATVEAAIEECQKWPGYVPIGEIARLEDEGGPVTEAS